MYNINTHYSTIFNLAKSMVESPSMMYLHPHGATEIENLESLLILSDNDLHVSDAFILCYDQEPLIPSYNRTLFNYVNDQLAHYTNNSIHYRSDIKNGKRIILLNTELDSDAKNEILLKNDFIDCYYFHHIFAAHDWFRECYYNKEIIPPADRRISKKFITMNRLTSYARVYRTLLINQLIEKDIINDGFVSYSRICPHGSDSLVELTNNASIYNIPDSLVTQCLNNISNSTNKFRIDFEHADFIPNRSYTLDPLPNFMESFLHVVTETNYWGRKKHLTEKIFKPIILKQPFVLVGCAHNLEYLKSYGFKTFDVWWNEDYDSITNDLERMECIGNLIQTICSYSLNQLQEILCDMQEVLEYNYNLFYSREFINYAWNELETNLSHAIQQVDI